MKVICPISGVPLWKTHYLIGMDLADEHPIFKAKPSLLLRPEMAHKFFQATALEEKRLIYLAVLNATNLVTFNVPAAPSMLTMEATFYRLMPLASWLNFAAWKLARIVSFPQYVVNRETQQLENVRAWMQALEEIKDKVLKKELDRDKNAELLNRESEIKKELGNAIFFGKAFTPKLAKWALELCDIGPGHDKYGPFMKLMCTPLNQAWWNKWEDYREIQNILAMGLPNLEQNPQAISVMHQINQLTEECKKGFTEFAMIEDDPAQVGDFEIIEEGQENRIVKINQHLVDVPTEQPREKDFAKRFDYLRARAKWELAESVKRKQLPGVNDV